MPAPGLPVARLLPISLRLRLTLWYGALVLLVLLGFTGFAYLEVRTALYAGVDTALADRAAQIAAVTTITGSGVQFSTDGAPSGLGEGGVFVFDRRGTPLAPTRVGASGRARPRGGAPGRGRRRRLEFRRQGNLRLYTAQARDDAGQIFIIQVAGPRGGADATLGRVLTALLLAVPILVLVSGAGGAFLAGRALRPIDRITRTARMIGAGDLHERLGLPPRDDEVGRLASTFDAMLDRLEGTFLQQRQFTADASHELRTPLTILQGEVEVALRRRRTIEAYEATLGTIREQVEGMTGIVEDLLALARADSGQVELDRELVQLDDLVRRAAAQAQPLFDAKGLRLALQVEPGILVIGDPDTLDAGDREPPRQRRPLHGPGRGEAGAGQRRGLGAPRRGGHRDRHRAGAPGAYLRALLSGGQGAVTGSGGQRPGAGDRPMDGRGARRHDRGRERDGPRQRLPGRAAPGGQRRSWAAWPGGARLT